MTPFPWAAAEATQIQLDLHRAGLDRVVASLTLMEWKERGLYSAASAASSVG